MGIYVMTTPNQSFFIPFKDFERCYRAMCALNTTHSHLKTGGSFGAGGRKERWFAWMSAQYPEECKNMQEVLEALGFTCKFDDSNNLCGLEYDQKTGQEELFLEACTPWIREGSFIEWKSHFGDTWLQHFTKCAESVGLERGGQGEESEEGGIEKGASGQREELSTAKATAGAFAVAASFWAEVSELKKREGNCFLGAKERYKKKHKTGLPGT